MEVILTRRGAFCLVSKGQRYRVDRKYKDRTTWRCTGDKCKARITTDNLPKPTRVLQESNQHGHDHETTEKELDTERVRTMLIRKAAAKTESIRDLACAEAEAFKTLTCEDIPKFEMVIKRIRLNKNKNH